MWRLKRFLNQDFMLFNGPPFVLWDVATRGQYHISYSGFTRGSDGRAAIQKMNSLGLPLSGRFWWGTLFQLRNKTILKMFFSQIGLQMTKLENRDPPGGIQVWEPQLQMIVVAQKLTILFCPCPDLPPGSPVVGGTVAVLLLVAAGAIASCWFWKRKGKGEDPKWGEEMILTSLLIHVAPFPFYFRLRIGGQLRPFCLWTYRSDWFIDSFTPVGYKDTISEYF